MAVTPGATQVHRIRLIGRLHTLLRAKWLQTLVWGRFFFAALWICSAAACGSLPGVFPTGVAVFCWQRLAGSRPGGRLTFLSHDKKVSKEACPAASVPESFALRIFRGNLRSEYTPACGITHCAPRRSIQTNAASQSTKFGCPSAAKPPAFTPIAGAG